MIDVSSGIFNVLIVGVGGQGTILASELLSYVALAAGYDVKKSEVHGMSQRGGRVESYVRFGKQIYSPLIPKGEVDFLVGFELAETLRSIEWLSAGGIILTDTRAILPYTSQVGESPYPFDALHRIRRRGFDPRVVEGEKLAAQLGEPKAANVVLMGALARLLPVDGDVWRSVIRENMPGNLAPVNLEAFELGYGSGILTQGHDSSTK
ncbi:indolepyruvate oxidoreductase subunit beta [bacterium BMS3Abin14]|nr:indolepyruvate oxidoreductase subunit beta [bacterium BMS3Abin14]